MLKKVIWIVFGVCLCSAKAYAKDIIMHGFGTATCGQFADLYRRDPQAGEQKFYYWAQGFMSGLNIGAASKGVYRDLDTMPMEAQESELRAYCNMHPLDTYGNAVIYLYGELDQKQYKPK